MTHDKGPIPLDDKRWKKKGDPVDTPDGNFRMQLVENSTHPKSGTLPPPDTIFDLKLSVAEAAVIQHAVHTCMTALEEDLSDKLDLKPDKHGTVMIDRTGLTSDLQSKIGLLAMLGMALNTVLTNTLPMTVSPGPDGELRVAVVDLDAADDDDPGVKKPN